MAEEMTAFQRATQAAWEPDPQAMFPNLAGCLAIINAKAEEALRVHRDSLPPHVHGWWRGEPNPYSVTRHGSC